MKNKKLKSAEIEKNEKYIKNRPVKRKLYISIGILLISGVVIGSAITSIFLFTNKNKNQVDRNVNLADIYNVDDKTKSLSVSYNYSTNIVPESIINGYNKLHKSFSIETFNSFVQLLNRDFNTIYSNLGLKEFDYLDGKITLTSNPEKLDSKSNKLDLGLKDQFGNSVNFTLNFLFPDSIDTFIDLNKTGNNDKTDIKQEDKQEDIGNQVQENIKVTHVSTSFVAKEFSESLVNAVNFIKQNSENIVQKYNELIKSLDKKIINKTGLKEIDETRNPENLLFKLLVDDFQKSSESLEYSILDKTTFTKLVVKINKVSDSISLLTDITDDEEIKNKIEEDLTNGNQTTLDLNNFDDKPITNIDDLLNSDSAKDQLGLNDNFDSNNFNDITTVGDPVSKITITTDDNKQIIININNNPTDKDKLVDSTTNITDNNDYKDKIEQDIKDNKNTTTIEISYITPELTQDFVDVYNGLRIKTKDYNDLVKVLKEKETRLFNLVQPSNTLKNTTFNVGSEDISPSSEAFKFIYETKINDSLTHKVEFNITVKNDINDFIDNTSNKDDPKPTIGDNEVPGKDNEYKKEVNFVGDSIPSKVVYFYNTYKINKSEDTLISLLTELNKIAEVKKEIDFNTNIKGLYSEIKLDSDLKEDSKQINIEFNTKKVNQTSKITYVLNRLDSVNDYVDNIIDEKIPDTELSKNEINLNRYFLADNFSDETVNIYNSLKNLLNKENPSISQSLLLAKYKELTDNLNNSILYNNFRIAPDTNNEYLNKLTINPDIFNIYTYDKYKISLDDSFTKDSDALKVTIKFKKDSTEKTINININKNNNNQLRIQQLFTTPDWSESVSNTYVANKFNDKISDVSLDNKNSNTYIELVKAFYDNDSDKLNDASIYYEIKDKIDLVNSYNFTYDFTKENNKIEIKITSDSNTKTVSWILSSPTEVVSEVIDKDNTNLPDDKIEVDEKNKTVTYKYTYIENQFSQELVNSYNNIVSTDSASIKAFTDQFKNVSNEVAFKDTLNNFTKITEVLESSSTKLQFSIKNSNEWTFTVDVTRKSKYNPTVIDETITGPSDTKDEIDKLIDDINNDPSNPKSKEINIDVYIASDSSEWTNIAEGKWTNLSADLVNNLNKVLETSKLSTDWSFDPSNFINLDVELVSQSPVNPDKISFKVNLNNPEAPTEKSYLQYNITRHNPIESNILDTSNITIDEINKNDDISIQNNTLTINYYVKDEANIESFNIALSTNNLENAIVELNKWMPNPVQLKVSDLYTYSFSLDGNTNKLTKNTTEFNLEIKDKTSGTTILTYKFFNKDLDTINKLFNSESLEFSIYDKTFRDNFVDLVNGPEVALSNFVNSPDKSKFLSLLSKSGVSTNEDNLSDLSIKNGDNEYIKIINGKYNLNIYSKDLSVTMDLSYKAIAEFLPTLTSSIKDGLNKDTATNTYSLDIQADNSLPNIDSIKDTLWLQANWSDENFNSVLKGLLNSLAKDTSGNNINYFNDIVKLSNSSNTITVDLSDTGKSQMTFTIKYKDLTINGTVLFKTAEEQLLDSSSTGFSYVDGQTSYNAKYNIDASDTSVRLIQEFNSSSTSEQRKVAILNGWILKSSGEPSLKYDSSLTYTFSNANLKNANISLKVKKDTIEFTYEFSDKKTLSEAKANVINYIVNSSSSGFGPSSTTLSAKFKYDEVNASAYSAASGNSKISPLNLMMNSDTSDNAQIKNSPSNGYFSYDFKSNNIAGAEERMTIEVVLNIAGRTSGYYVTYTLTNTNVIDPDTIRAETSTGTVSRLKESLYILDQVNVSNVNFPPDSSSWTTQQQEIDYFNSLINPASKIEIIYNSKYFYRVVNHAPAGSPVAYRRLILSKNGAIVYTYEYLLNISKT